MDLEKFTELSSEYPGIDVSTLSRSDTVTFKTVNSTYKFQVIDPQDCSVVIKKIHSSKFLDDYVPARIYGASIGSSIKLNFIIIGMSCEFIVEDDTNVKTSPVKQIYINDNLLDVKLHRE